MPRKKLEVPFLWEKRNTDIGGQKGEYREKGWYTLSLKRQEDIQWEIPVGNWRNRNKSGDEKIWIWILRVTGIEMSVEAVWPDELSEADVSRWPH